MTQPRTRLSREESRIQTRARLLDAAAAVLAELGFHGASVEMIAERAGYSKGAIYSNFESKEALFLELLRAHKQQDMAQIEGLLTGSASVAERFAVIEQWLEAAEAQPAWTIVTLELALQSSRSASFAAAYAPLQQEQRAAMGALISGLFAACHRHPPQPPEALADALTALFHGLNLARQGDSRTERPSVAVSRLLQTLIAQATEV